jgi:hypothetical protein
MVQSHIRQILEQPFQDGGYKLDEVHFENGRSLHGNQYIFAKKFLQNSENCKIVAEVFVERLRQLAFNEPTTLIGYRSYTGLLLNRVLANFPEFNHAIVEEESNSFVWRHRPALHSNLVVVLPITCTCATYIRIRKFVERFCRVKFTSSTVNDQFINVISILDRALQPYEARSIRIAELDGSSDGADVAGLYSAFNWTSIGPGGINLRKGALDSAVFVANPLIRVYSEFSLPESCQFCFPVNDNFSMERPLFPTQDNFETPDLIFGLPSFGRSQGTRSFVDVFGKVGQSGKVHLRGHIRVGRTSYSSFIRGNEFYEMNKADILEFFDRKLDEVLVRDDRQIAFITAENKHNSNFLEDISMARSLRGRTVTILRFQPSDEFIDNFFSLHAGLIESRETRVLYFEDVMSAGKTFKLVSNYIKHLRNRSPEWGEKVLERHGFDLVLTLVDRTPPYTADEIVKKIHSDKMPEPETGFLAYFRLNVPIVSAAHLGNPLNQRIEHLETILDQCHLDSLKLTVGREIVKRWPRQLPEVERASDEEEQLRYFPFGRIEISRDRELEKIYRPFFSKERGDLLSLHISHLLHDELSTESMQTLLARSDKDVHDAIPILFENVRILLGDDLDDYLVASEFRDSPLRRRDIELEIVKELIIKTLSKPPFVYYKTLYEQIFRFCVLELQRLYEQIEARGYVSTSTEFRRLRFLLRRAIDLNSNFMVSLRFLACIKQQYTKSNVHKVLSYHRKALAVLNEERELGRVELETFEAATANVEYKIEQVNSFFPTLLFYYKELIAKNPSISIRLEELVNAPELLPPEIRDPFNPNYSVRTLITDSYFQFTGMVKAENLYLLNELKELHKRNIRKQLKETGGASKSLVKPGLIRRYYFKTKNDPVIVNARKLLSRSRHKSVPRKFEDIQKSVVQMLAAVSTLEVRRSRQRGADKATTGNFSSEIKEILEAVISILRPGLRPETLRYGFFVEYRKRTSATVGTDNIFSFLSEETPEDPSAVRLSSNGLIYNMLYGICDDSDRRNEQTLMFAAREADGDFVSFKPHYYLSNRRSIPFSRLYAEDFYNPETGLGVPLLSDSNMSILIRLANLRREESAEPQFHLEGSAVLLITCTEEANLSNFLDFMSNEKIRLLLLIKEELLEYLEKQFDNDAFIDILENRKKFAYQSHLRHGLGDYLSAQSELVSKIVAGQSSEENYRAFRVVTDAIKGQLKATKIDDITLRQPFDRGAWIDRIRLVFESDVLGNRTIDFMEIDLKLPNTIGFVTHPSVFNVVVTELLINMKKYCPRTGVKGLLIEAKGEKPTITFRNRVNRNLRYDEYGGGEGLTMCRGILEALGLPGLVIDADDPDWHSVTLCLN